MAQMILIDSGTIGTIRLTNDHQRETVAGILFFSKRYRLMVQSDKDRGLEWQTN